MSGKRIKNAVGLISVNSIDYVEKLFNLYECGQPAVLLKDVTENKKINGISLTRIIEPKIKTGWFSLRYPAIALKEEIAQVSFTSGTEGEPKAIAITHGALDNTATRLVDAMHMDKSIKEYIGAPVNFSFGLGRCRAIAKVQGKGYLPPNGFDPIEISRMLANNEINAISAVPTLWRILLENKKYFDKTADRIKWIEIGSQYMSRDEKAELRKLFPSAKIIQHYGLTEASRTTFLDVSLENGALESVGKPSSSIEVKLNSDSKVCIKGPHLCSGIVINGEVHSLCDKDGWFETSDFGEINNGFLYYKGRADDIINCGGIKLSPEALEREVRHEVSELQAGFCISKVEDEERGEIPLIAVLKSYSDKQSLIEKVTINELKKLGLNISSLPILTLDEFPATATGKIQRKLITAKYKPISTLKSGRKTNKATSVKEVFEHIFKKENINQDSSFNALGGDSLSYVKASIALEEYFGYLPQDWNHLSIAELDAKEIKNTKSKSVETNVMLRCIAILAVVIGHSGVSFIGGGTQLLIVLVGFSLARFQSKNILSGDVWSSIYKYSIKILIPYMILVVSYFIWKESFSLDRILLYTNYLPFEGRSPVIFPAWFIQVLLQSLVLLGLLFSFKRVRDAFRRDLWLMSYLFLMVFILLRITFPYIYDTNYLYQRVPPIYLASLWLGWAIFFSKSSQQKAVTFITAIVLSFEHLGVSLISLWISVGSFLLLYKDSIKVPRILKVSLTIIAAATFYIYLFHMIFIHIPESLLKLNSPLINTIFGVLGSLLVWYLFDKLEIHRFLFEIPKHIKKLNYRT